MLSVTNKALMGLKSFGMIYLAILDNQEAITRRKRKRSNQREIAQARDLPFSSSPSIELCQIVEFYQKGNIRAISDHTKIPGCAKQSLFIYGQAFTRMPAAPAQLLISSAPVQQLLLLHLWGGRFCFFPLH